MTENIIQISESFWNIRGDFKIGGIVNIGTHSSLVKCANGKFVLLDSYTLDGEVKAQVDALTNNGTDIDAIINLHPFHTMHVLDAHEQYPNAKLYGTQRHVDKFPDLAWQSELTESQAFAKLFEADLEFSVPAGVEFIPDNQNLHFSSVLAYHKASKTIHVDDTLMYLRLPGLFGLIAKPEVKFHPTLSRTLETRAGAAADFHVWVTDLAEQWKEAENLCAAHSAILLSDESSSATINTRILRALQKVGKVLRAHEKKYG